MSIHAIERGIRELQALRTKLTLLQSHIKGGKGAAKGKMQLTFMRDGADMSMRPNGHSDRAYHCVAEVTVTRMRG